MHCMINPTPTPHPHPPCTPVDKSREESKCVLRVRDVFKKNDAIEIMLDCGRHMMNGCLCLFFCNYSVQVSANTVEFITSILENILFPQSQSESERRVLEQN